MPVSCRLASLIVVTLDGHAGDGVDGFVHGMLDVVDLRADIAGRFGGLLRQRLDLGGDDGEAAARRRRRAPPRSWR